MKLKMLCVPLLFALPCSAHTKEWPKIRIGVDSAYPPFESIARDGQPVGFTIDVGNALCARLNARCVWVQSSFDGLIPGLKARKFDVILSSMAVTEKRREQIDFTDRVYRNQTRLIVAKGSTLAPDVKKLAGRRVGVQQGTVQEAYGRQKWAPHRIEIVPYATYNQAYADLLVRRLDAVMIDAVQGKLGFLDTPRGEGFAFAEGVIYDARIMGSGNAAGVRKSDPELRDALNRALAEIRRDGTYRRIEAKYFDLDMRQPD